MAKDNPDIPEWFDLSNYTFFRDLSSKSLSQELYIRQLQLEMLDNEPRYTIDELIFITNSIIKVRTEGQGMPFEYKLVELLEENMGINPPIELYWDDLTPIPMLKTDDTAPKKLKKAARKLTYGDVNSTFKVPLVMSNIFNENHALINLYFEALMESSDEQESSSQLQQFYEDYIAPFKKKLIKLYNTIDPLDLQEISIPEATDTNLSIGAYRNQFKFAFSDTPFEKHIIEYDPNFLPIILDLNSPDDVILQDIQNIINTSRKPNKIKDTNKIHKQKGDDARSGGKKIIKSIIEKRVIPFIDLLIWEKENNYDMSDNWFKKAIYPDLFKHNIHVQELVIYDTVRPLANKCLDSNWLKSFYSFDIQKYNDFEKNPTFLYPFINKARF